MAKVPFSKLNCKFDSGVSVIHFNNIDIEVKHHIPVQERLQMIGDIINAAADDTGYWNPGKISIFTTLYFIYNYTNISFTEKQKQDPAKLYDLVISSGLFHDVYQIIDSDERNWVRTILNDTLKNIYNYQNSIYGILDTIATDYSDLELDAEKLRSIIGDPENITLLKDVITKLG